MSGVKSSGHQAPSNNKQQQQFDMFVRAMLGIIGKNCLLPANQAPTSEWPGALADKDGAWVR